MNNATAVPTAAIVFPDALMADNPTLSSDRLHIVITDIRDIARLLGIILTVPGRPVLL